MSLYCLLSHSHSLSLSLFLFTVTATFSVCIICMKTSNLFYLTSVPIVCVFFLNGAFLFRLTKSHPFNTGDKFVTVQSLLICANSIGCWLLVVFFSHLVSSVLLFFFCQTMEVEISANVRSGGFEQMHYAFPTVQVTFWGVVRAN